MNVAVQHSENKQQSRLDRKIVMRRIYRNTLILSMLVVAAITAGIILIIWGFLFDPDHKWQDQIWVMKSPIANVGFLIVALSAPLGVALTRFNNVKRQRLTERSIHSLQIRARSNPEKPQLAWDLARLKLESYLDRNLRQVSSIFWLTSFVMSAGLFLVFYGIWRAFDAPNAIYASTLASASGVVVQIIGGTLLLIYKSTMEQAKNFSNILERINAVGMSINILEAIDESETQLRNQLRAEIARDLLTLYSLDTKRPSGSS